jgi:iron complex outermembrane receptor protein
MSQVARSYENVDARLTGGDLAVSWAAADRLFFSADIGAVYGSKDPRPDKGITTSELAEMPPATLRLAGRYDTGTLFVELEGVFADDQDRVDGDLGETPTPGYGVANLRVGATWGGVRLVVGLLNVLDRQYSEALSYQRDPFRSGLRVPEPGRNFSLNLAVTL